MGSLKKGVVNCGDTSTFQHQYAHLVVRPTAVRPKVASLQYRSLNASMRATGWEARRLCPRVPHEIYYYKPKPVHAPTGTESQDETPKLLSVPSAIIYLQDDLLPFCTAVQLAGALAAPLARRQHHKRAGLTWTDVDTKPGATHFGCKWCCSIA